MATSPFLKKKVQKLNPFMFICTQIQMDKNTRKLRNQDINPCIEVSFQIIYILHCVKQSACWEVKVFESLYCVLLLEPLLFSGK